VTVTAPGLAAYYRERYPGANVTLLPNGYDERDFKSATQIVPHPRAIDGALELLHSGVIYESERDPAALFAAVSNLRKKRLISPATLQIKLRSPGNDAAISRMITSQDIGDIVRIYPPISHLESIREMMDTDGLLVIQAANSNNQIPAKLFEYLRARKPILGLTDPAGDTAGLLYSCGLNDVVRLDRIEDIESGLMRFISAIRDGSARLPPESLWLRFSRESQAAELARLLDAASAKHGSLAKS
jgi:glycosyltransferase involved in cell wall biosynthesis